LGGVINVTPDVATRIAQSVARQFGTTAAKVTNSQVWQAMTGWLRNPDAMPDELKVEPQLAPASQNAAQQPPSPFADLIPKEPFREHVIEPGQPQPREPVYQGGVREEPFTPFPRSTTAQPGQSPLADLVPATQPAQTPAQSSLQYIEHAVPQQRTTG